MFRELSKLLTCKRGRGADRARVGMGGVGRVAQEPPPRADTGLPPGLPHASEEHGPRKMVGGAEGGTRKEVRG